MKRILFILAAIVPITTSAQTISLEQCLQIASEYNISMKAARASVDKSRILEGTAWDLDKTELSLSQDPTSGGSPDNALTLSQSIDFPTTYVARRHQLKAETQVQQAEASVVDKNIRGQITALYYQLIYQQAKIRLLQSQDTILQHYKDIATKRYDAGEVRQLEPLNARRLLHENKLALDAAKSDFSSTQTEMARLIGKNIKLIPAENELKPFATDGNTVFNFDQTAEGLLSQTQLTATDKAVKVAKTGYAPTLSLGLRTQMVIKGWNPYHVDRGWNDGNFMGFEFGIGIPIFNSATRARVKAAKKERELMELQVQDMTTQRESEYTVARNRLLTAKNQLDYYKSTGIEDAKKTVDVSAKAYENGEIGYIEYVSAMQQGIDTSLKYAAAVNDYNQAVITIRTLAK